MAKRRQHSDGVFVVPRLIQGFFFPFNGHNFEEIVSVLYHPSYSSFNFSFLTPKRRSCKSQHESDDVFSSLMYVSVQGRMLLAACDWMLHEALSVVSNCMGKHNLTGNHCSNHAECTEEASSHQRWVRERQVQGSRFPHWQR